MGAMILGFRGVLWSIPNDARATCGSSLCGSLQGLFPCEGGPSSHSSSLQLVPRSRLRCASSRKSSVMHQSRQVPVLPVEPSPPPIAVRDQDVPQRPAPGCWARCSEAPRGCHLIHGSNWYSAVQEKPCVNSGQMLSQHPDTHPWLMGGKYPPLHPPLPAG